MTSSTAMLKQPAFAIDYGPDVEAAIERLLEVIAAEPKLAERYPARWLAIELLEEDSVVATKVAGITGNTDILTIAKELAADLRSKYNEDVDTLIADRRYGWINTLVRETVRQGGADEPTASDKIDQIVTNRWLASPSSCC